MAARVGSFSSAVCKTYLRCSPACTTMTFFRYSTYVKSHANIMSMSPSGETKNISAKGWVNSIRNHKNTSFLHLTDGSCPQPLQVVISSDFLPSEMTYGASVSVEGELVNSPFANQAVELRATSINIIGTCQNEEYPFHYKTNHSPEYIRGFPHLRPKTNMIRAMLRLRNSTTMAIHKYFQDNGFCYVHTPIITSNDCEGAGETFQIQADENKRSGDSSEKVQFFGVPTYLSVSGQLHLEAITGSFGRAYSFGPTFRAEKSHGRHHLSEFYMVEGEMAFTESLDDIILVMEELVKFTTRELVETAKDDLWLFFKHVAPKEHQVLVHNMMEKPFSRMTYTEAIQCLEKKNSQFKFNASWGCDLQKEHEKYLVEHCGNMPVFITDFPASSKPFYARHNEDGVTVAAVDLLVPGSGELIGGTLREERYDVLKDRLCKLGLEEQLSWYLDIRRFGTVPHGGFGLGFERYLQCILGIPNLKDAIPFPRQHKQCKM